MKKNSLTLLWPYIKPHLAKLLLSLLLSIPLAAVKVGPAPAIKFFTDYVLIGKNKQALTWVALAVVGLFVVNFVVRFFHFYIIRSTAQQIIQKLRNDLYAHLMKLSLNYFGEAKSGAVMSRVINDVQLIVQGISNLNNAVREPLIFMSLLGYAIYLNWRLTVLTFVIAPLLALLLSNTGKHIRRYSGQIQEILGELSAHLTESFSGMRIIKGFNLESFMRGRFMQQNRDFTRISFKAIRVEEMAHPGVELLSGIAIAIVLFYGGHEVLIGHMSAGDLFAFFASFALMMQPLRVFSELNIRYNQTVAATDRVFAIFNEKVDVQDSPDARVMPLFTQEITFQNITFSYNKHKPVIKNFDLKIRKGELVAFVGASGAGKTTIVSLIPRFYDPEVGSICIDGVDIKNFKLQSLRSQIALVSQEVFLFHDTVRMNIRAGNFQASEADIIAAAKAARAWDFIEKLPHGLDTVIGDRGQKLSGGERQRLSIARAILRNAPILLLDEATSSLDTENELLVQEALEKLLIGKTAVVIAHRLSTIRKANRIFVMEQGKIIETGTHDELIAKKGAYARALSLQEGFRE